MRYRMIQVGTGGFGARWCQEFLPACVKKGLIEVAAAVDINPEALGCARDSLGLREDQCYTEPRKAFDEVRADFCTVVVPPSFHEEIVDLALAHDMHILSEKPIADTMQGSLRIADKVRRAGKKMGVTMSHRFDQDKTTLREEIRSGKYGPLDALVCRLHCDRRRYGSWNKFRHEMRDPLIIEGAVHHLDYIADMAGALCEEIYVQTWNSPWGEFKGDPNGYAVMRFANGVRALFEGYNTAAVGLNGWWHDYVRAEMERATLVLSNRRLESFVHDPSATNVLKKEGEGTAVPLLERWGWLHPWLIEKFCAWLDGGGPMETNVEDNMQSVALIFSAIESSRTGRPVRVQEFLQGEIRKFAAEV